MSKSRVWQSALTLVFAASMVLLMGVGCSKQGEGERCDLANAGNTDCDDGLTCQKIQEPDVYRCCPPEGAAIGDSRCQHTGVSGTGGASSSGGASSGGKSSGGATSGGATTTGGAGSEAGATNMSGGSGGDAN